MRLYVRAYARASRLQVNARIMHALAVSEKVQQHQGQTIAGPITTIERINATQRVTRDLRRIQLLLGEAIDRKFYALVPDIVDDLLEVAMPVTNAVLLAKQTEMAEAFVEILWQGVPAAVQLAKVMFDPEQAFAVLLSIGVKVAGVAMTEAGEAKKFIERYEQELLKQPVFDRTAEVIQRMRDMLAGAVKEREKPTSMAERRAFIEQQAIALGVNLGDPDDRIAQIVRIGLDDLDPTRVARRCRHIHLRLGSSGVPAKMLGLPTAGSKSIICLKHGHSLQGLELDDVYARFSRPAPWAPEQMCCEKCPDVSPHPDGWEWSQEWWAEQDERFHQLFPRKPDPGRK